MPVVFLSVAISFASEFITKHEFGILGYLAIMLGVIAQIIMGMGITKIAGVLTFFVGLFITIPITAVATAHVYRQLVNKQKATV